MSKPLAIIGGTGLTQLPGLSIGKHSVATTPWGEPSGPITHGVLHGQPVIFLPRHGTTPRIPPHKVNYRANLWALKDAGATRVLAVAAVGGIRAEMAPGDLVIPDQVVDYTWSRDHTYFEDDLEHVVHIDFTEPYAAALRNDLVAASRAAGVGAHEQGTYAATQGPRLETAAEIDRLERDGCDVVGMTGMPEAALARELELDYATCAVVVNAAAGRAAGPIRMEDIEDNVKHGMAKVATLIERLLKESTGRG